MEIVSVQQKFFLKADRHPAGDYLMPCLSKPTREPAEQTCLSGTQACGEESELIGKIVWFSPELAWRPSLFLHICAPAGMLFVMIFDQPQAPP